MGGVRGGGWGGGGGAGIRAAPRAGRGRGEGAVPPRVISRRASSLRAWERGREAMAGCAGPARQAARPPARPVGPGSRRARRW